MQFRAYRMRLKNEHVMDYEHVHKKGQIWNSVITGMKKAGFTKMIIFQEGQDIILFEEANDLKKAYKYYSKDETSQKWDKMILEWMEKYPGYNEIKGDIDFEEVPVIFYYDRGRLLH